MKQITPFSRVIQRLLDSGWTQKELARKSGTSQATISRLVRDEVDPAYSVGVRLLGIRPKRAGQ